jgi:hypothetical protein
MPQVAVSPDRVFPILERNILVDGFHIVIDLETTRSSLTEGSASPSRPPPSPTQRTATSTRENTPRSSTRFDVLQSRRCFDTCFSSRVAPWPWKTR